MKRDHALAELATGTLDVLVIGGGIVGSGIARDAALRGMRTGLIDANDFAFGTSSRSSRLLHGGIRYLAQGRIRLVREASKEKRILHNIAPHLAEPLPFCFPAYRGAGWPLWQLRLGVIFYDLLAGKNLGRSQGLNIQETLRLFPGLKRDGLNGAVSYFDAMTHDARLVIDTLRSAANAGALLSNYTRFLSAQRRAGELICQARDEESGRELTIRARAVVNAAGPWAEGLGWSKVKLRLTKGIHLVFDAKRLPTNGALVITEGARVLFVLPWGTRTIVGTTDTDFSGPPESVKVEAKDVEYLLATVNHYFPETNLAESDVASSYAGLRPLIGDNASGKPSDISRSHSIRMTEAGWWDVAGGKLTTYRLMAEQTIDQISKYFGKNFGQCVTSERELLSKDQTDGISQIVPPPISRALVKHFVENEWARNADDILVRRGGWKTYASATKSAALQNQVTSWINEVAGS